MMVFKNTVIFFLLVVVEGAAVVGDETFHPDRCPRKSSLGIYISCEREPRLTKDVGVTARKDRQYNFFVGKPSRKTQKK